MEVAALIISLLALGIAIYTLSLPRLKPEDGKKFAQVTDGEQNVSVKIIGDKQFLVDEEAKILDLKRI